MREIDLHVHTNISDGSETPAETVKYARSLGLRAIAVTDHDSINGVAEAQKAGKECGLEVVAGMELGCGWYGREVHMLGYDLDIRSKKLPPVLDWIVRDRDERNRKMVDMLARDGLFIDLDELQAKHPGSTIGRPHCPVPCRGGRCRKRAGCVRALSRSRLQVLYPPPFSER